MITVKPIKNTNRLIIGIRRSVKGFRRGVRNGLFQIGRENVKHARKLIQEPPKTGRIYSIGGKRHQASAAGEAPANRTGMLKKSVGYRVRASHQVEFGDEVLYGKFLEEGTRRMSPRPHLITTVNAKERDNKNALLEAVNRELKRRATS